MTREEDYELVRRMCSSDPEVARLAFGSLYERYRGRVFNTAFRVLGDRALAADVTQETFLLIFRKARKFNFRSAFTSWLYRVTVNQCIDSRRKEARHRPISLSDAETASWLGEKDRRRDPPRGPMERTREAELAEIVGRAVASLNPRLAAVVVLRYIEGLGYAEIAEALEMPIGTVKSRLNRAHAALEHLLGPRLDRGA